MAIKPVAPIADNTLASDVKSAQSLRSRMKTDQAAGIRAAAQEFEAMFLQMVMKSMRETTSQDGFLDSDASRFFTGMLDEQMAKNLSRTGQIGLAEMLEAQLTRQFGLQAGTMETQEDTGAAAVGVTRFPTFSAETRHRPPPDLPATAGMATWRAALERSTPAQNTEPAAFDSPRDFVTTLWPHAVEASRDTGIPPQFLIAHAALESGWGRRNIPHEDGSPTHNLFGIKAGESWQGKSAEVATTEYTDGVARNERARFRAYDSYASAFRDYARLLRDNPRYGGVIGSQDGTEFARRLQQAGYATDPKYAEKLAAIINGPTLREALIG
ncbi:MAG: flagellar assembly peptidoglycan hydrolase FlgJ [Zoogloeaceae bacterium]|jgi:flagellar protein FlgJ|nr:flagellar assembly peptidoglycan hydrolase FlgJ [Zoogloeaceae bacterium]